MRNPIPSILSVAALLAFALAAVALPRPAHAQETSAEDLVSAVVQIRTFIDPDARTRDTLGREREGSGIVIDESGLVLTIGYLIVEAYAAEIITNAGRRVPADVVGYDHDTGFGLLRATELLRLKPLPFGRAGEARVGDPVLVASFGGAAALGPARIVAKRPFAGAWEYLLDEAIFTAPPAARWSGAALVSRAGRLLGVGSLVVGDAGGRKESQPGNMFVPIDLLPPILADLLADGRVSGAGRPWLGLNTDERGGQLVVSRVTPGGPADKAGIRAGDAIAGVNGDKVDTLAALYRQIWAQGGAGATVALDTMRGGEARRVEVRSINRLDHLKLKSTF